MSHSRRCLSCKSLFCDSHHSETQSRLLFSAGIVAVAALAARTAGSPPVAASTATWLRTSSAKHRPLTGVLPGEGNARSRERQEILRGHQRHGSLRRGESDIDPAKLIKSSTLPRAKAQRVAHLTELDCARWYHELGKAGDAQQAEAWRDEILLLTTSKGHSMVKEPHQVLEPHPAPVGLLRVPRLGSRSYLRAIRRCRPLTETSPWFSHRRRGGAFRTRNRVESGARPAIANWWISIREGSVSGRLFRFIHL